MSLTGKHILSSDLFDRDQLERLYELAEEPKRLLMLEGGDHRSAQHDAEVQGDTLSWLARALDARRKPAT